MSRPVRSGMPFAAPPLSLRAAAVIAFPPTPAGQCGAGHYGGAVDPASRGSDPEPARDPIRDLARDRAERLARLHAALPGAGQARLARVARPARRDAEAPTAAPSEGFERLRGIGPGLAWALGRAGIADLAALAALEPAELVARLGPLGRLVPARDWIAAARGEARAAPSS